MGIDDLAKETGVKVVTIRYYERVGVLPAVKRTRSRVTRLRRRTIGATVEKCRRS
jgi:DNA-binding transcriptional MerR regulator